MGFFNKGFGKILAVAIPTAIATYFGGPDFGMSVGQFMDSQTSSKSKSSGGGGGGAGAGGSSQSALAAQPSPTATAETAAEIEKKKKLALNAQGASGNTTTPLGTTGEATVTKRFLLGG